MGYGSLGNPSKSTETTWLQFVCPTRPDYRKQRIVWFVALVRIATCAGGVGPYRQRHTEADRELPAVRAKPEPAPQHC